MPLLCNIVKHSFQIPPVLVVWWRTTSQTRAFVTVSSGRSKECAFKQTWCKLWSIQLFKNVVHLLLLIRMNDWIYWQSNLTNICLQIDSCNFWIPLHIYVFEAISSIPFFLRSVLKGMQCTSFYRIHNKNYRLYINNMKCLVLFMVVNQQSWSVLVF
jgi:hypothetical protein